jgi:hypothetical protein
MCTKFSAAIDLVADLIDSWNDHQQELSASRARGRGSIRLGTPWVSAAIDLIVDSWKNHQQELSASLSSFLRTGSRAASVVVAPDSRRRVKEARFGSELILADFC